MFAFTVCPAGQPHYMKMFLHPTISSFSDLNMEEIGASVKEMFGDEYDLEDMEFFEVGEHKPITVEKHVHYTVNQMG